MLNSRTPSSPRLNHAPFFLYGRLTLVSLYTYKYIYIYIHTYTYIHIYIYTYTHIYIYIYILHLFSYIYILFLIQYYMFSIYIYMYPICTRNGPWNPPYIRGIYEGPILLTPEQQQKQGCGREVWGLCLCPSRVRAVAIKDHWT